MPRCFWPIAFASFALCAGCASAPSYVAPPLVACTGPWREVESASTTIRAFDRGFAKSTGFEAGTLWVTRERFIYTGGGPWEGVVLRADHWGATPSLRTVPEYTEQRPRLWRLNGGSLALGTWAVHANAFLQELASNQRYELGAGFAYRDQVAMTRDETVVLRAVDRVAPRIDRYRPRTAGASGDATLIASTDLSSRLAATDGRIFASNRGEAYFVVGGPVDGGPSAIVLTFNASFAQVGTSAAVDGVPPGGWSRDLPSGPQFAVDEAGLWVASTVADSSGATGGRLELLRVLNDGSSRRTHAESLTRDEIELPWSMAARTDTVAVCASRGPSTAPQHVVELFDSRSGDRVQRIDTTQCESVAFSHDSLFVTESSATLGSSTETVTVRRFTCN